MCCSPLSPRYYYNHLKLKFMYICLVLAYNDECPHVKRRVHADAKQACFVPGEILQTLQICNIIHLK